MDKPAPRTRTYQQSQRIPGNPKRARELDWEATRKPAWVMYLSLLCILALCAGLLAVAGSDRVSKPTLINGDQLGPIDVQGPEYAEYATNLLDTMEGEEPRWALVSRASGWSAAELGATLEQFDGRVSTLYFTQAAQWVISEPTPGQPRLQPIADAIELWASRAGMPAEALRVRSVLVFGTPAELRALHQDAGTNAGSNADISDVIVEPAPVGAVYGRIGVRAL